MGCQRQSGRVSDTPGRVTGSERPDRMRSGPVNDRCEYTHGGPIGHVDPCHQDRKAHDGDALGHEFVPHPDAATATRPPAVDLMAALRASLDGATKTAVAPASPPVQSGGPQR